MGQNCIGIERLIVHGDQFDELIEILEERVSRMRVGSVMATGQAGYVATVEGGSMIHGDRFAGIERLIREATEAGAIVFGGGEYRHPMHDKGFYFQPTIVGLINGPENLEIAREEGEFSNQLIVSRENLISKPAISICTNRFGYTLQQSGRSN